MITSFQTMPQYQVYNQALLLSSFEAIKDTFLAALAADTTFTDAEKNAIRLAAEKLRNYPDSNAGTFDGPLLGILNLDWDTVGAAGVSALIPEQREAILEGVLDVCRGIIQAKIDGLTAVRDLDTALPEDWDQPEEEEVPAE